MRNNGSRVFVTQENSQLNYTNAEAFGEVVFLTSQEVSPIPSSLVNAEIMAEMARKLHDFDFDTDFIAPSGSPVVSGMAFLILGGMAKADRPRKVCVLRWSNRDRVYQPITIDLHTQ